MKHVRSDEGIARGPRKKTGPKPSSPRRNNGQFLPILPTDPVKIKAALEAYCAGASLQDLADQYGVYRNAIYSWLLGGLGDTDHSTLVTQALTARISRADGLLEDGDNPLDATRGDRMARWARQDLERRRPHLYGPKQEITLTLPEVNLTFGRNAAKQLDSQVIDVTDEAKDKPI